MTVYNWKWRKEEDGGEGMRLRTRWGVLDSEKKGGLMAKAPKAYLPYAPRHNMT